jgi:hypothetical protein
LTHFISKYFVENKRKSTAIIIGPGSHVEYPTGTENIQGTFLLSFVPIGPVVSEKKLEM